MFTRHHADDNYYGTKINMSPPAQGGTHKSMFKYSKMSRPMRLRIHILNWFMQGWFQYRKKMLKEP